MSCVLYSSPIFGPVHSRRLGTSLGINLLPATSKICSFDCVYCECGLNASHPEKHKLPTRQEVREALEKKLIALKEKGITPDVFTFAGNGEPTSHPHFEEIIDDTLKLRDKYFPNAKVSVLSNSTFLKRDSVIRALKRVDNNILKLDTVDSDYIHLVDRPNAAYDLEKILSAMEKFDGQAIVQTMFMKGSIDGKSVDNTSDKFVDPWIKAVKKINPREVMIYTLARETPYPDLLKASKEELDRIRDKLVDEGLKVQVSY